MGNKLKNILVTGVSGYIGSRLIKYLGETDCYNLFLVSRNPDNPDLDNSCYYKKYSYSELLDGNLFNGLDKIDVVIHLSAVNEILCAEDPVNAYRVNTLDTKRIIELAISNNVKRFIYLSTAHIYNNSVCGMVDETVIPHPVHPYATSHLLAEQFIYNANKRNEMEGVILRLSNSFGYPEHKNIDRWTLLVNSICLEIAKNKRIVLKSDGTQKRDFITMTDVIRGIRFFINIESEMIGDGIFNLGGDNVMSILDLATLIAEITNDVLSFTPEILIGNNRDSNSPFEKYSIEKIKKIGFKLEGNIKEEIKQTLLFCWKHFHE